MASMASSAANAAAAVAVNPAGTGGMALGMNQVAGGAAQAAGTQGAGELARTAAQGVGTFSHDAAAAAAAAASGQQHPLNFPHGAEPPAGSGLGAGLIWLLVLAHLAFVASLAYSWWRQRPKGGSAAAGKHNLPPQKINCVYEFALPVIIQTKSAP